MSAQTTSEQEQQHETASYIYGLVFSDTTLDRGVSGVGEPPAEVQLVSHGQVAALVSEVDLTQPLGTPEDLLAHEQLLDAIAADVPVLPLRFGAVMTNQDAVADEFLAPHEEEFAEALKQVEGRAQYMVRARFVEDVILREILTQSPQAKQLRDQLKDKPEAATRDVRIRLGELINQTVAAMRDQATQALAETLQPHTVMSSAREPGSEMDAANLAVLVDMSHQDEFQQAVEDIEREWDGRITVRVVGPLAPYDFVVSPQV